MISPWTKSQNKFDISINEALLIIDTKFDKCLVVNFMSPYLSTKHCFKKYILQSSIKNSEFSVEGEHIGHRLKMLYFIMSSLIFKVSNIIFEILLIIIYIPCVTN